MTTVKIPYRLAIQVAEMYSTRFRNGSDLSTCPPHAHTPPGTISPYRRSENRYAVAGATVEEPLRAVLLFVHDGAAYRMSPASAVPTTKNGHTLQLLVCFRTRKSRHPPEQTPLKALTPRELHLSYHEPPHPRSSSSLPPLPLSLRLLRKVALP